MAKVAVAISGLPRIAARSLLSWDRLIRRYDADVYMHLWDTDDGAAQALVDRFNPSAYVIEPPRSFNVDHFTRIWYRDAQSIYSMWTSIKCCMDLIIRSNRRYDTVIRGRTDISFDDMEIINQSGITIPGLKPPDDWEFMGHTFQIMHDLLAYGDVPSMRMYSDTVDVIEEQYLDGGPLFSEFMLCYHLFRHKIPIHQQKVRVMLDRDIEEVTPMESPIVHYNSRPNSAEAAQQTAAQLSIDGMHDAALMFVEKAWELDPDLATQTKLLETTSISGFYSKMDTRRLLGKQACEKLALDKTKDPHARNVARQNSTYYARSASELMPRTTIKHLDWNPGNDYAPMNPSIACNGVDLWMIVRTVNYRIRPEGTYDMRGDTAIRTINHLLRLNHDLSVASSHEILMPNDMPDPLYKEVFGFEDCRLFFWRGEPWCTATVKQLNQSGRCEIVLARLADNGDDRRIFADWRVISPAFGNPRDEKNWMPMVVDDRLYFLYSSDPTRVIDDRGNLVVSRVSHISAESFRGGGSLISWHGGWLGLIHESHAMPDWRRRYMHRWVWYDSFGRLARYSEAFYLKELGIEFAAGIMRHPITGQIVASFSVHDASAWMAAFDQNDIKRLLKPAGKPFEILSNDSAVHSWFMSQTNNTLKDTTTVNFATDMLASVSLPVHRDSAKDWDNIIGLWHASITTEPTEPVMDVGATPESAFLPGLRKLGYVNLTSINLTQEHTEIVDGITYANGDCTATTYPNDHFGFISCLSVIEHGVDLNRFFAESARILRPGGHLLVSTDYWQDPVDTRGQMAFGVPVKVFTAHDISEMIKVATGHGLVLTGNVDLSCKDKVVNWIGMDYTFINILFMKPLN